MEFKAGAGFEAVFAIEGCGFGINGMHQDGTAADDLRTCVCALQRVFQQSRAKPLALLCLIKG